MKTHLLDSQNVSTIQIILYLILNSFKNKVYSIQYTTFFETS